MRRPAALACALLLAGAGLSACGGDLDDEPGDGGTPFWARGMDPSASTAADPDAGEGGEGGDEAVSETREDSVYPDAGDPSVDALHYDLTLDWAPETRTLTGSEVLTFRSTATADDFQLDFSEPMTVSTLTLDGEEVEFEERGKDLVVTADVEEDQTYELALEYAGQPGPVPAPTSRSDFNTTGFTVTDTGEAWTMQEPFGAYTWYAVNDQPADKALYDFTLSVPTPWVGVANGALESRTDEGGTTTTVFSLASPAASYLTTVAFGDFEMTEDESASGVPITYWVGRSESPQILERLKTTPAAMAWLEERLGPYPFDTFGTVVVDSESGMETQTMVTLGNTDYTTSEAVIVHELAHQWYGDTVTPEDWRDVWMNEGMAMYLQGEWQAEQDGRTVEEQMDEWAEFEGDERAFAGPPAAYDPEDFGSGNIYYGPALMWHELRERIGDEAFAELIRAWPEERAGTSTGRDDYLPWIEEQTGEELTTFLDDWLLGETTPPRD